MSAEIGRASMQVGNWIRFTTTERLNEIDSRAAGYYEENQRYLVISKQDDLGCRLISSEGKSLDYDPVKGFLDRIPLALNWVNVRVLLVTMGSVQRLHGAEKIHELMQNVSFDTFSK